MARAVLRCTTHEQEPRTAACTAARPGVACAAEIVLCWINRSSRFLDYVRHPSARLEVVPSGLTQRKHGAAAVTTAPGTAAAAVTAPACSTAPGKC